MIERAGPGHYPVSSVVERSLGQHWRLLRAPLGGVEVFVLSLLVTHWGCWEVSWAGRIYTLEDKSLEHRATTEGIGSRGHVTSSVASSQDGLSMLRLTMSTHHPATASHLLELSRQGRWRSVPL